MLVLAKVVKMITNDGVYFTMVLAAFLVIAALALAIHEVREDDHR